ncbi:2-iminoacetate synthase ThiH [Sinorhizobium terangae]|uniref:Radical SAM protein n=1 Tax=Sinorhizobium terangae TaxID=110322 RepID=A0A6N7LMN8_SINTE|nr:hypothetical protein [Sinorhizobium terangae]MBB4189225.1 2-iminoacetate synthase ThiH [Sinorhizobium terangae]MQX19143.1 hypothetical protein [Sinorhizobium terangae]
MYEVPIDEIHTASRAAAGITLKQAASTLEQAQCRPLTITEVAEFINMMDAPDFDQIKAMVLDCSAKVRTRKYGRSVVTLSPVEVTNRCASNCSFCGWRSDNKQMGRLSIDEEIVDIQVQYLLAKGIQDIELVGGDDIQFVRDTLPVLLQRLRSRFLPRTGARQLLFCTMALTESQYHTLAACGADGMIMWQETYDEALYNHHISRGPKAYGIDDDFHVVKGGNGFLFRLQSQDRAAKAGLNLAVGTMLGLNKDVVFEVLATIHHARYLCKKYAPKDPVVIGMPTWNKLTTNQIDNRPKQILNIDKYFSFFASLYLLALSDLNVWVFPNCRVSRASQIEAIKVAGAYTSTEVKIGPGGYLPEALKDVCAGKRSDIIQKMHTKFYEKQLSSNELLEHLDDFEQFQHYFYLHEDFARALAAEDIEVTARGGAMIS